MTRCFETPANFFLPFTKAETWLEMALRLARSSSYLGSVLPSKQVVAQEPVTEGVETDAEAIFLSAGIIQKRKNVQRFELFPIWYRKGARRIKCVVLHDSNLTGRLTINIKQHNEDKRINKSINHISSINHLSKFPIQSTKFGIKMKIIC